MRQARRACRAEARCGDCCEGDAEAGLVEQGWATSVRETLTEKHMEIGPMPPARAAAPASCADCARSRRSRRRARSILRCRWRGTTRSWVSAKAATAEDRMRDRFAFRSFLRCRPPEKVDTTYTADAISLSWAGAARRCCACRRQSQRRATPVADIAGVKIQTRRRRRPTKSTRMSRRRTRKMHRGRARRQPRSLRPTRCAVPRVSATTCMKPHPPSHLKTRFRLRSATADKTADKPNAPGATQRTGSALERGAFDRRRRSATREWSSALNAATSSVASKWWARSLSKVRRRRQPASPRSTNSRRLRRRPSTSSPRPAPSA